jgi:hypothetical protein
MTSPIYVCPHCGASIPESPEDWLPPWQCCSCSCLYGIFESQVFAIPANVTRLRYLMSWDQAQVWCHYSANSPYVYALCYPTGLPFYVGKGRAQRMLAHAHFTKMQKSAIDQKERTITALHEMGLSEAYAVLALCDSDEMALRLESTAIHQWGRRVEGRMLTNIELGETVDPVPWNLPPPPVIAIRGNPTPTNWVIHPSLQNRAPRHRGVAIECPSCRGECYYPAAMRLDSVRCPICMHFFDVDADQLYQFWLERRHDHSRKLSLDS